jgi:peptidoglycan/xylan/chitin deacetylase (PgdA/CDA1 family)
MRLKLQAVTATRLSEFMVLLVTVPLLIATSARPGTALTVMAYASSPQFVSTPVGQRQRVAVATPFTQLHHATESEPNRRLEPGIHLSLAPPVPRTDCSSQPCIALSFDDGPSAAVTPQVLTILEQHHIPATFFLIGKNIDGNQTLVQRMAADGFEVGNHSWSHPDMTQLTPDQIKTELLSTQAAIVNAGAPLPTLFRPPYGAVSDQVLADAGLQAALWNIDPVDWQATDPIALAQNIINTAKPGGIVDLHDIHQVTADALPAVLDPASRFVV